MANFQAINYDEIWEALERFNFDKDPNLSAYVVCIICHKILINAYQGPCGCKYCKKCITEYLQREKFCPGSTNDCKSKNLSSGNNLIKDNGTNRQISKLRMKCPLNKCNYENELGDLVDHIKTCKCLSNHCPFLEIGCQAEDLENEGISEHLQSQIYNHNKLMVNWMMNLQSNVLEQMEKFQHQAEKQMKKQSQNHDREISILKDKCCILENEISQSKTPFKNNRQETSYGQQDLRASFKWVICNLSQKRKVSHHVMSGYFYTYKRDFEMRLRLCLSDHHNPSGGDMSLKFFIHKGKTEVENIWPFKGNISIAIMNKADLKAGLEISKYCEIQQPVLGSDSTNTFEFPFLDLQRLKVLESDSIIIECNITGK